MPLDPMQFLQQNHPITRSSVQSGVSAAGHWRGEGFAQCFDSFGILEGFVAQEHVTVYRAWRETAAEMQFYEWLINDLPTNWAVYRDIARFQADWSETLWRLGDLCKVE